MVTYSTGLECFKANYEFQRFFFLAMMVAATLLVSMIPSFGMSKQLVDFISN
jgi:hypothetical protein